MYKKLSLNKKFKIFLLIYVVSFIFLISYNSSFALILFVIFGYSAAMLKCPKCGKYLAKNKLGYYSTATFFDGERCTKCNYSLN